MIQEIRGTKDILPEEAFYWRFVEENFKKTSENFGYGEIRTPIFERTEVFSGGIGEGTDVVNKEMYTFTDRSGNSITLRPEMTAALVRSAIRHSLLKQNPLQKLWYFGPFFRYERPQAGRMRQFHQYGAECLGSANPESDAEILALADALLDSIGIDKYKLLINTLGNDSVRANYRDSLVEFFKNYETELSEDSRSRLEKNPLRILDSKNPKDIEIVGKAPNILDALDDESRDHFEKVKKMLDEFGIAYEVSPLLVRGLDYYCHTVFEFRSEALGAQDSFGGGGRYDGLFSRLGGKDAPAVGFAMGIERILMVLEKENKLPESKPEADIYLVAVDSEFSAKVHDLCFKLRKKGLKVGCDLTGKSVKAQFREANKSGAKYAAAIGGQEIESREISVKNMNTGEQTSFSINDFIDLKFMR